MALSTISIPSIEVHFTLEDSVFWRSRSNVGARVSETNDDLPEPETPVTETIHPRGIFTSIS